MQYVLIDTETTGVKPPALPASGVAEVAFLILDEDLNILQEACHRINPGEPISAEASAVHGIFDADVANCPTLGEVLKFEPPITLIGHNVRFDYRFLKPFLPEASALLCTLDMARRTLPNAPNHKLSTLIEHLGLDLDTAHSALGDVHMTRQILKYMLQKQERTLLDALVLSKTPTMMHTMPFGKHKGTLLVKVPLSYLKFMLTLDISDDLRYSIQHQVRIRS